MASGSSLAHCTNVQVLAGSDKLSKHDEELARLHFDGADSITKYGAFEHLCKKLERHYNLDFIVVDLSPGTSAFNRSVIMRQAAVVLHDRLTSPILHMLLCKHAALLLVCVYNRICLHLCLQGKLRLMQRFLDFHGLFCCAAAAIICCLRSWLITSV
jgi:hypothetical protein